MANNLLHKRISISKEDFIYLKGVFKRIDKNLEQYVFILLMDNFKVELDILSKHFEAILHIHGIEYTQIEKSLLY